MKKIFLILIILLVSVASAIVHAQNKYNISGSIIDSITLKPLAYVTVSILDTAKVVAATYTDERGRYTLSVPAGRYTLRGSLLGYTHNSRPIEVVKTEQTETMTLSEGVEIAAAVVTARLVTADIDKTTYNTAADPETPALTALEMIKKVPMLSVDGEDNIRLKGEANFKILVNGKTSTMMNSNYKDVLKSMPAGSIKNIEVITNPPAKYDAEGVGGIINIVTNRETPGGYNGSLSGSVARFGSWNMSGYIAASVGKLSISANYFVSRNFRYGSGGYSERENYADDLNHYITTDQSSHSQQLFHGGNIEASYQFDTMNLLTLSLSGFMGGGTNVSTSAVSYFDRSRNLTRGYTNDISNNFNYGDPSVGVDYQHSFKRPDRTLTASYKFDYSSNPSSYDNMIVGALDYPNSAERSDNSAWGSDHTFQLDYFDPITKHHQVEVGAKFIMRPNVSDSRTEHLVGDDWVEFTDRKNDLDYLQYIGSVYAAYQYKIGKFSAKAGARAEYTLNTGTFKLQQDHELFNRYFNVIPYVTLGFKPSDNDNFRLGYTQRISRPGIWYLNPYVDESDPLNKSMGNPALSSEISNKFDFSYGRFGSTYNINTSISASFNNNAIEDITVKLPDGSLLTAPENIGRRANYNLSVSANVSFWERKISLNANGSAGFVALDANNGSGMSNSGWQGSVYVGLNGKFWKNGTINLGGYYSSPYISLQGQGSSYYSYNFSVSQWFLDRKLMVGAFVSNPFTSQMIRESTTSTDNYNYVSTYYSQAQRFGLSLQWRFGKVETQIKKASRGISNDDVAGGSKQGGGVGN